LKSQEHNLLVTKFTAVKIQVQVIWVVIPCSVAVGYQCFG